MEARASCRGGSAAASFFLRKRLRPGEPPGERVLKGRPPGECVLKGRPPGERHGRQQMPRLLQELGKAERELRLLPCLEYLWEIRNAWVDSETPGHLFIDPSTHPPPLSPTVHTYVYSFILSSSYPGMHPHSASTQLSIHTPPSPTYIYAFTSTSINPPIPTGRYPPTRASVCSCVDVACSVTHTYQPQQDFALFLCVTRCSPLGEQ